MSDFCIYCETEPIDKEGWVKSKWFLGEWVCPWCVKDGRNE